MDQSPDRDTSSYTDSADDLASECDVVSLIGEGAMGRVYLVSDPSGRPYAMKTVRADQARDEEYLRRFERECRLAARLKHPNIIETYETGLVCEGQPYILTEFCPLGSLADALRNGGAVSPPDAARWLLQLADALAYAWDEHRVIHRDIKPGNILLDTHMDAKLADMGFAKRLAPDATVITEEGIACGSAHYMAPEMAQAGNEIDFHADMYSVGACFYHLLTGRTLFDGPSQTHIMMCHVNDEPRSPREIRSDLPVDFEVLLLRLLQKLPDARFATYADLAGAIRAMAIPEGAFRPEAGDAAERRLRSSTAGTHGGASVAREDEAPYGRATGTALHRRSELGVETWGRTSAMLDVANASDDSALSIALFVTPPVKFGRSRGDGVELPVRVYPADEHEDEIYRISSEHGAFGRRAGAWCIRDLGSRNGTRVGGEQLEPHTPMTLRTPVLVELGGVVKLRCVPCANMILRAMRLDDGPLQLNAWPALCVYRLDNREDLCYALVHERLDIGGPGLSVPGSDGMRLGSLWWLDGTFWWQPAEGARVRDTEVEATDLIPLNEGCEWRAGTWRFRLRTLSKNDFR